MRKKHHKSLRVTGDSSLLLMRNSGDNSAGATGTWFDIRGSNNGTPNNAGILSSFYFRGGGAGTDDMVTTAFTGVNLATEAWSVEMWVTRDALDVGQVTLAGCRAHGPNGGWLFRENSNLASGPIDFDCPGFTNAPDIIPDIIGGSWAHIVVTRAAGVGVGAGHVTAYLNGVQTYSAAHNYFGPGDIFEIAGSTYNRWAGFIDDVRCFQKVLSADEILRDYNAGKAAHL